MLFDNTYFIYVIPALIITILAQINVKSTFSRYSKVRNSRGVTGQDVARQILDENGLYNVRIERVHGSLTDHYDPSANVVRLSDSVHDSTSVAAIGVAAHEVGHAIQHSTGYIPIKVRAAIIPLTQIGSMLAFPLVLIGLSMASTFFVDIGILLFAAVVLFQLVTLPVEFNASFRAMRSLNDRDILYGDELKGSRKVLTAAALTYVGALAVSLLQLLRLISLKNNRR
ncbi:MAG: zinc metallopeptidase [Clostridiales bacterium]|nr:zinc metallopeptidase [Clostridiales bacterium]